jgi:hypothetical protein
LEKLELGFVKRGFTVSQKKKRDFYEVGMICVLLGVIVDGD